MLATRHTNAHLRIHRPLRLPLPRRQGGMAVHASTALVEETREEYKCWTNPPGKVLTALTDNVWACERPFLWNKIDVGGRMAVLRLSDGSLWVQSPVALDETLKAALAELGPVKHIVSPNYEHIKFAQQWMEAYPDAKSYACPGLKAKQPQVSYTAEVGQGDTSPADWLGDVESTFLSFERNPFNGKPFFNEVVFLFKPAGLLITSDLFWNYPANAPFGTKLWKFGMDRIYLPFYRTFMIKDKDAYHAAMTRLLGDWQWDAILPCHGDFIRSGGKRTLRRHLGVH
ncbi:hypothetical protein WJX72_000868 [[Myrmecia] bisecta]|uniref:DUF4336 domain-containing protein n=1 Tax=[Myrmecia] bisecta TaxID=41462 RepID=A0AAW1PCJ0_9CHLO